MEYSNIGGEMLNVSRICLGTMTFGEQNTEVEAHEQMDYALSLGVNFFDTAEMYAVPSRKETQGLTERYIGNWFAKSKNRDRVVLATKITGPSRGLSYIRNPLNYSDQQLDLALEGSLRRLRTDYIDLYQLHWPERNANYFGQRSYDHSKDNGWIDNFGQVLEKLNNFVKAGKIRCYGISNETPWGMHKFISTAEKLALQAPVTIQNPYNLLNRTFETGLAEMSIREKVGLLAYSPMAFGLLSGKYNLGLAGSEDRLNKFPQMSRYNSLNTRSATDRYINVATQAGLSPATLSLAFINAQPFVASTIIGATNIGQLKENIESVEVKLSPDIMNAINNIHENIPNPST